MSKVRDLSRLWTFLLIGITLVSAQGRDYKLTSAGEEKTFRLIDQLLTAEDEELTPTMKLKRKVVTTKYASLIDTMYPP